MTAPASIEDLGPDVRLLTSGPGQAYLVRTPGGIVLVDTGSRGSGDLVSAALRDWGLDRDALRAVLLTHWHADHAGSAAEIGSWPRVRVYAHRSDAPVIRGEVPGADPLLTSREEVLWARVAAGLPDAPPARVDVEVVDNQELDGLGVRVVATPGHTDGSVAFHVVKTAVLCTGDIAAESDGAVILGPFNTDRDRARSSFRRLGEIEADTVCFGHGRPLRGEGSAKLREAATAPEVRTRSPADPPSPGRTAGRVDRSRASRRRRRTDLSGGI